MVEGKNVKNLLVWVGNDSSPYTYDNAIIYVKEMKQIIHITRKTGNTKVVVEIPITSIKIMEYENVK